MIKIMIMTIRKIIKFSTINNISSLQFIQGSCLSLKENLTLVGQVCHRFLLLKHYDQNKQRFISPSSIININNLYKFMKIQQFGINYRLSDILQENNTKMDKTSLQYIVSLENLDTPPQIPKYISTQMVLIVSSPNIPSFHDHANQHLQEKLPFHQEELSIDKQLESKSHIISKTPSKKKKGGCVCKKTNCLKLYCECFASGKLCTEECACFKCCNTTQKLQAVQNARFLRKSKANEDKKCNCSNSKCLKGYCACYSLGQVCGPECSCVDCHNTEQKKNSEKQQQEND